MATLEQLGEDVAKLAASPRWSLSDQERSDSLRAAYRLQQAATALTLGMASDAEAASTPARLGDRNLSGWLRHELQLDPSQAKQMAEQSALVQRWPRVWQALLDGKVDVRQAAVIASTVDDIPGILAEVDDGTLIDKRSHADIVQACQERLIMLAGDFAAYQIRRLGQRILDIVAPEIGERAAKLALQRQEKRAYVKRGFTLSLPRDGLVRVTGALTTEDAAIVNAALDPLCKPAPGDDRTEPQKRADALVDVCQLALRTGALPDNGGEPPQVSLTADYDTVTGQVSTGTLDNGERVSAETVRRMACDARILPFVVNGAGQVLNAGRTRRTATGPLRRAVFLRDGGCAFPDCDRPPRWAQIHHIITWLDGGPTDLPNLVALCGRHHRLIHDPREGWEVRTGADELPEFLPPAWLDLERKPRRNEFHRRN